LVSFVRSTLEGAKMNADLQKERKHIHRTVIAPRPKTIIRRPIKTKGNLLKRNIVTNVKKTDIIHPNVTSSVRVSVAIADALAMSQIIATKTTLRGSLLTQSTRLTPIIIKTVLIMLSVSM
jgi:hypothetical protein